MTLHQLRIFLAVADAGSIRAAAQRLVVSQPAVSAVITALERELGVDLFEREGRGIKLSPAGHAYSSSVRAALQQLDHAARLVQSLEEPSRGSVRLAAIATAAERLVLPLLASFRNDYPEAEVQVRVGNRATVWQALRDREVDLVVAGRPPADLEAVVLGVAQNTLVLVGRRAPPGDQGAGTGLLRRATWLLREPGSGTRDAADALMRSLGVDPPRMIIGSNNALIEAVAVGFGVGLVPLAAVQPRLDSGEVVRIDCPGTPIERPWHLVGVDTESATPTCRLMVRSLLNAHGAFVPTVEGSRFLD